jgi:hypothetical protein
MADLEFTVIVTEAQLNCLANDLVGFPNDVPVMRAEIQRRLRWVIEHKVLKCAQRMVADQAHILGATRPVTLDDTAVAIGHHHHFKTRDMRDAEQKIKDSELSHHHQP